MAYITTTSKGDYDAQWENVGIPDGFNGSKPHRAPGRRILYHFCDCRVESKRGIIRRVKYWGCVSAGDSNGRIIFIADAHREFIGCNKCRSFNQPLTHWIIPNPYVFIVIFVPVAAELSIAPAGASWLQRHLGFVCTTLLGIGGSIVGG